MNIPEDYPRGEYPNGYSTYVRYLCEYDDCLLTLPPFIPFWVRTLLGSLDLIGPETDAHIERIVALVLEQPTYEYLHKTYPFIRNEIVVALGTDKFFTIDETPLGLKYGVILNVLDGLLPEPFSESEWIVSFSTYAIDCFELDDAKRAILDERIKVALRSFEPDEV